MRKDKISQIIEKIYLDINSLINIFIINLNTYIRRFIRFIALPYYFIFQIDWGKINKSKIQVAKDLIYIFFKLKYYPDNYCACRLFEKERNLWITYYGSNYDPFQRKALRKIQPKEYEVLFEDKEVCMLLCKSLSIPQPKTLGIIDPSGLYRKELKNMVKNYSELIAKPVRGAAGKGIIKIINQNGLIKIESNDKITKIEDFVLTERSIVQEIVAQNDEISRISELSVNTIRVLTLLTQNNDVKILGSTMRFGIGNSFIDNWSAGGIAVGVNVKNGTLKSVAYNKNGDMYKNHPLSKIIFEGFQIPRWNDVIDLSKSIQKKFSFYKLLGFDIALTHDGPVVIEINAFPDFVFQEQTSGPLLDDKDILTEFKKYNLLINKYQISL